MGRKRDPKAKRVRDASSGRFESEDTVDGLIKFGYSDEDSLLDKLLFWKK